VGRRYGVSLLDDVPRADHAGGRVPGCGPRHPLELL